MTVKPRFDRLLLASLALALGGCTTLHVTYESDPQGATLYQDGQPFGQTPVTLTYQSDAGFQGGGCQSLKGTTVKWASGANASIAFLSACANVGRNQRFVFVRPDGPGREIDANFALQSQRNNIMQQQVDAQNSPFIPMPLIQIPQQRNCTTRQVGDRLITNCY